MSFPRTHRLITQAEYKLLFNKGLKVSDRYLTVLYKKNNHLYGRLGLIVAKKVAKQATSRNQIKRVIRESFRFQKDKLFGIDIVVIARQHCNNLSKQTLREGIDQLWEKLLALSNKRLS